MNFSTTFENELIHMRPLLLEDAHSFLPLTSDDNQWLYFTHKLSDPKVLKEWVKNGVLETIEHKRLALTIIHKPTNKIVGSTSLANISERDKRLEIGWTWIAPLFQGTGVNDQSKLLLLRYCFEELSLERVEFKTDVLNLPARKALLRIGAKEEGILRSHTLMTNNRRRDTIYYSILKSEWPTLKINND